ncbi:glucuronate isomerase [Shimia isoporae]|uniref:Uronate isomerase n=1 Tax=Shimia isoporae TaxID=647720 RepID=A0A4R1N4U5_9RHOB|nr:glucuronate isomerase [Shimia isoporae]TCL00793.1 glucuronate isomerase [Shimia isoporae]
MKQIGLQLSSAAQSLYEGVKDLPITSPHGHCDPQWFVKNEPFSDPASLLIVPDHYVFRMLYSLGVSLTDLGIGVKEADRNPRAIFGLFAQHWDKFLGTPSRGWLEFTLYNTLGVETELSAETANMVFDEISSALRKPELRPLDALDTLNIELLATTDAALDPLDHHEVLSSGTSGRVIPTFRPDDILNPSRKGHAKNIERLGEITGAATSQFAEFLDAIASRRAAFKSLGATATDHDVPDLYTEWLPQAEIELLHQKACTGSLDRFEARRYYGHMLIEMAQMSVEDGLVMQLHVGSRRSTNETVLKEFGADKGADIPHSVDWVHGLNALLNRVGNNPNFRLLAFTLDESTYARELAPMAGHWPCMRLGPPWWFHDSLNGIRRYLDQVVESAGYWNLAGFNDDTRAFLSIPARHDMWRRGVCAHLSDQMERGVLRRRDAERIAPMLSRDLARDAYRLNGE